jgi:predicted PurR-regulated permease PerM
MASAVFSQKEKTILWVLGFCALLAFIYLIKSILLPFVVAMITAYFLDPAADKLEKWGMSRFLATGVITLSFFAVLLTAFFLLAPVLYDQCISLIQKVPHYVEIFQTSVLPSVTHVLHDLDPEALEKAKAAVGDASGQVLGFVGEMIANVWQSGMAFVNLVSLIFVTPIVTFYVLRDWDVMVNKVDSWLPVKHADTIRVQIAEINRTLSGYIRGQTNVCLFLGIFYATGLMLAGLDFGLFIGLGTGLLAFIPYVGMAIGMATGLAVAFFQFGGLEGSHEIGVVLLVFLIGQVIEGNFLTPKLVGTKVGLHPVWIIFGMLAGAALFGFTGILLAVPVTAVIGVLARFFLSQYLKGQRKRG